MRRRWLLLLSLLLSQLVVVEAAKATPVPTPVIQSSETYFRINSTNGNGTCAGNGGVHVNDNADCKAALLAVGNFSTNVTDTNAYAPGMCVADTALIQNFYFGTGTETNVVCPSTGYTNCYCRHATTPGKHR